MKKTFFTTVLVLGVMSSSVLASSGEESVAGTILTFVSNLIGTILT